jgi:hypothetical protein
MQVALSRYNNLPAVRNRSVRFDAAALLKTKAEGEHRIRGPFRVRMLRRSQEIGNCLSGVSIVRGLLLSGWTAGIRGWLLGQLLILADPQWSGQYTSKRARPCYMRLNGRRWFGHAGYSAECGGQA